MAIIRPSSDLRNKYKEISELCKRTQEPVYITMNGKEDTVIMSFEAFNELYQTLKLIGKLNRSLEDIKEGRVMTLEEVRKQLL